MIYKKLYAIETINYNNFNASNDCNFLILYKGHLEKLLEYNISIIIYYCISLLALNYLTNWDYKINFHNFYFLNKFNQFLFNSIALTIISLHYFIKI